MVKIDITEPMTKEEYAAARRKIVRQKHTKEHGLDERNKYMAKHRERLQNYLSAHPCVKCGQSDMRVLQFHHRVPVNNSRRRNDNIRNLWGFSWARVLEEIEKCDVLCANCHAIVHWEEKHG